MILKVKYHADIIPLQKVDKGDWIDLRAAETVELKKDEFKIISLGVSIELPAGYEAQIVPRSSTYKNWSIVQIENAGMLEILYQFGVIQTNYPKGIIDNSYCGNNDIWRFPALAVRDTVININDRICQFRVVKKQPEDIEFEAVEFYTVDHLDGDNRGGFGSTGVS